jgi:hypothetical protein
MPDIWHYASNQFDNATKTSFKAMSIFSPDHKARLNAEKSDPDILALLSRYTPVDDAYNSAYTSWIAANGIHEGETLRVNNYLDELSNLKIKQWDSQVRVEFLEDTPDYKIIFPSGREPFQKGGMDQRIYEVRALSERLTPYAALSTTKTDVDDFYTLISGARALQQTAEETIRQKSDSHEFKRIDCAVMQYGDLGKLMDKFRATPEQITRFFDLTILQRRAAPDVPKIVVIAGGDTVNVFSEGITDETQFVISNVGTTNIKVCRGATANSACIDIGIELVPNETRTVTALQLGPTGNNFLNVTNLDPNNQGTASITMLA